jgi:hypothetical protein
MKKQLQKITAALCVALISTTVVGQINPTAKTLPMYEDFGTTTFTTMPAGFASGMVSSAPLATQTAAQSSAASGVAAIATATVAQTNGGSYGLANSGNGRMYIQHSASTTTGTNQLILAINTLNWHSILISYGVEMINANPRTAGLVLQYRVGTSGSWSNISGGVYSHSSADRANGTVDNFTNLSLPTAAENQPVVQLRWASWRGTQTGNSSGVAVDNVNISASPQGLNTNVSVSSAAPCTQIYISQYVQDSLTNDAIQLYNPSTASINLSGYYLTVTTGTNAATYFPLSGTIQAGKVFVLVNAKAPSAWLRGKANQLVNNLTFNGNQVVGLVYSTNPMVADVMIDAIGDPTITPANGYTVSAMGTTGSTKNHTLVRLPRVTGGDVEWSKAQFEWYSYPVHTYGFLGFHNSICHTEDDPDASFAASSSTVNITNLLSGTTNTFMNISLTGQWDVGITVYVEDSVNSGGLISNCSSNTADPSVYSYANSLFFPADTSSYPNPVYEAFQVHINNIQLDSGEQYVCFAILDDPNQNYDVANRQWTLDISTPASTAGIQTLLDNKLIKVYPNPFSEQFTIENTSPLTISKVSVTDILGREVISINPEQKGMIIVNTQSLNKGAYFVKVYNNTDNFTVKLIKE